MKIIQTTGKEKNFIKENIILIIFIGLFVVLGNTILSSLLYVSIILIVFGILKSKPEHSFCWSIFLIPNIRMFDTLGITYVVNILMILPIINILYKRNVKKTIGHALLMPTILFLIEFIHIIVLEQYSSILPTLAVFLGFSLCVFVTLSNQINVNKDDIYASLTMGIFFSCIVYLLSNVSYSSNLIYQILDGNRFSGFSGDPNFYSLYICLAIACWLGTKRKSVIHIISLVALFFIGLLTASKMCILLMIINLIYIMATLVSVKTTTRKNKWYILFTLILLIVIAILNKSIIYVFFENFLKRLGGSGSSISQITTGRSTIIYNYLHVLLNNAKALLFGYGFNYHLFLDVGSPYGAHNTYLDLILSWGIFGTLIFMLIIYWWIHMFFKKKSIHGKKEWIFPLVILLINFCDLSCISASMFFFVITISLLQITKKV